MSAPSAAPATPNGAPTPPANGPAAAGTTTSAPPEKCFVIDTNVLIHRPDAILSFKDNVVVLPLWVLEELDKLKTFSDERARNARAAIRLIDSWTKHGDLSVGIKIENNITLRVVGTQPLNTVPVADATARPDAASPAGQTATAQHTTGQALPAGPPGIAPLSSAPRAYLGHDLLADKPDNKIILTAYQIKQRGSLVFFVSKDINARLKATALGIKAVDYEKQKVDINTLYTGFTRTDAKSEFITELLNRGTAPYADELHPNQFLLLRDKERDSDTLARYHKPTRTLRLIDHKMPATAGVRPLNDEQRMALELLLDPAINLVTLVGKAGTGKTLLAIAAGLKQVLEDKTYTRLLISRPVIPLGKDIGYLPGAKNEKLSHWMQPLFDNLGYILSVYHRHNFKNAEQLIAGNIIELEAIAFIRGRSLPNQFIIIDEAQNLTPHEVKTIVSRAGTDSKVVLTGDPFQIDSPYLDANSNGLTYLVDRFKGQEIYGHVMMNRTERSKLAELATELL